MSKALIVVDVQNDFVEGGALPVAHGIQVAKDIAEHLRFNAGYYDLIVATKDWHIASEDNNGHFSDNPDFVDTWPVHCVADTWGAEFSMPLHEGYFHQIVYKGQGEPAYSGFDGLTQFRWGLDDILRNHYIESVRIMGIAYDYCVKETALDAVRLGYQTTIASGFTASVANSESTTKELLDNGVVLE